MSGASGGGSPSPHRERGLATGLVAAGLLVLSCLVAAAVVALLTQITVHRVQGAADVVAVTAAQAKNLGTSGACTAASRAAEAADVTLLDCTIDGDELRFVVTVAVRGGSGRSLLGVPLRAEATAHAGMTRGG